MIPEDLRKPRLFRPDYVRDSHVHVQLCLCLTGRENICRDKDITGETVDGGYAEYILASYSFVYPVPDNLTDEEAAPLFCPGVTAYRAIGFSGAELGKTVAVFGVGGVGHLAIQFAKMRGARVVAVTRSSIHAELAGELGADSVVRLGDEEDALGSLSVDSAVVFAPSQKILDMAFSAVKPGGVLIVGVLGGITFFPFYEEKTVKGSVIGTRKEMLEILAMASEKRVRVVTETYPLSEADYALRRLKNNEVKGRAVLLP